MKVFLKPISSPGRAEKYPPPLMRFLRSNVGSRSRGRSRTSPMIVRKKSTTVETQEPSSPKVTCMGQVRVKRSKLTDSKPGVPTRRHSRGRCKWNRDALFSHHFPWKAKGKPGFRCSWKKWGEFFHIGCSRKPRNRKDSSKFGIKTEDSVEEEDKKEAKIFASSSSCSSPPKNALVLTRCRSAPYRSSSLACRFWGSPLANQDKNEEETEETKLENRRFHEEEENPTAKTETTNGNSDRGTQIDIVTEENLGFVEKRIEKMENNEQLKTGPVILRRCKSEPARTAERLNP